MASAAGEGHLGLRRGYRAAVCKEEGVYDHSLDKKAECLQASKALPRWRRTKLRVGEAGCSFHSATSQDTVQVHLSRPDRTCY